MQRHTDRVSKAILAFVENPVTNLVKGLALLLIGLSDVSQTFREDIAHGRLRVGHGIIIIGFFGVLGAIPHIIEGLEAGAQYIDYREAKKQERKLE
ncbi:hypothetical protein P12x_001109 [Tundrisphaera lichenicola]|uniref:hypothetical protein n=1 Tax=Tundrisphaera lichenicola TaxID=2029860 RepID=UPI003EBC74EC